MTIETLDAVIYTAGFLVPGFVWSAVISMLLPRRSAIAEVRIVEFLTLSCLNHAFWSWLLLIIFKGEMLEKSPNWAFFLIWVVLFVSPVVFGILTALLTQRPWIARFLARFGFRLKHVSPTAWDYHFAKGQTAWTIVTLRDRSRIFGWYGSKSFAGDDPERRDLYLEAVYVPGAGGTWVPQPGSNGVLIAADEIAVVEFL